VSWFAGPYEPTGLIRLPAQFIGAAINVGSGLVPSLPALAAVLGGFGLVNRRRR